MIGARDLQRLGWLAGVGLAATAMYAGLAWAGIMLFGLASSLASLAAYCIAAAFSYHGHRRLTFRSNRSHGEAVPLFAGVSAFGYVAALAVPALLTDALGLHPAFAIVVVCLCVPLVNVVALSRLVFRSPLIGPPPLHRSGGGK